jgi:hypothetical protein
MALFSEDWMIGTRQLHLVVNIVSFMTTSLGVMASLKDRICCWRLLIALSAGITGFACPITHRPGKTKP